MSTIRRVMAELTVVATPFYALGNEAIVIGVSLHLFHVFRKRLLRPLHH